VKRRVDGTWLVSIAIHAVIGVALWRVLELPSPLSKFFRDEEVERSLPVERIGFVQLPKGEVTQAGKSGGDARAIRPEARPRPRLVAPVEVPTTITPPPPQATQEQEPSGSGPIVGGGGPTQGVRPSFADPRVWVAPGNVVSAPKTFDERLDSALTTRLKAHNDTMAVLAGARKPGDWTFERDGKKYGWDQQGIHLGGFYLPNAILAALPLNAQANPKNFDPQNRLDQVRRDILEHANQAMNEQEFRNAVRAIRERKDREREEARRRKRQRDDKVLTPVSESRR
jgi:hypothetical protein